MKPQTSIAMAIFLACTLFSSKAQDASVECAPLPGKASTSFDIRTDDGLLIRVGIVEEILRVTLEARFKEAFVPWKFSSIVIPDPDLLANPQDASKILAPRLAIARTAAQWSANASMPSGFNLSEIQINQFLSDVYIQAAVGGPGLNTISGILSDSKAAIATYGYVASLTQFAPTFGLYASKTAYVIGYSIVPLVAPSSKLMDVNRA